MAIPNLPLLRHRSVFARSYKNLATSNATLTSEAANPSSGSAQLFQTNRNPNSCGIPGRNGRGGGRCMLQDACASRETVQTSNWCTLPESRGGIVRLERNGGLDRSRVGIAIVGRLSVTFASLLRRAQLQPGVLLANVNFSPRHPSPSKVTTEVLVRK